GRVGAIEYSPVRTQTAKSCTKEPAASKRRGCRRCHAAAHGQVEGQQGRNSAGTRSHAPLDTWHVGAKLARYIWLAAVRAEDFGEIPRAGRVCHASRADPRGRRSTRTPPRSN